MNERICRVLVFFNCTTAPFTASPWALVTTPCTERMLAFSSFFAAHAAPAESSNAHAATAKNRWLAGETRSCDIALLPVLFGFFLVRVLLEVLVFVLLQFFGGFQFEGVGPDYLQVRSTLVATDGVAFVHIFFIDINGPVAYRACNHS